MKHIYLFFALLFSGALSAYAGSHNHINSETNLILGHVVTADTEESLPGAVAFLDALKRSAVVDADGHFVFKKYPLARIKFACNSSVMPLKRKRLP